jgi:hypothetical protein
MPAKGDGVVDDVVVPVFGVVGTVCPVGVVIGLLTGGVIDDVGVVAGFGVVTAGGVLDGVFCHALYCPDHPRSHVIGLALGNCSLLFVALAPI